MTRLTLRIDFDEGRALGPGKVRLLELVSETGSISAAGRVMGMSYRRAWMLIDGLDKTFRTTVHRHPLKLTRFGGALPAFIGGFTDAEDTPALFP